MLAQNPIGKCDHSIFYASHLLNLVGRNCITNEHEALAMVYGLHKFRHNLLSNHVVFYVYHIVTSQPVHEVGPQLHWPL